MTSSTLLIMSSLLYIGTALQLGNGFPRVAGLPAHAEMLRPPVFPLVFHKQVLTGDHASDHKREFLTWQVAVLPHRKRIPSASAHFPWIHLHEM